MNGDRNGTNRFCGGLAWDHGGALYQDRCAWWRRVFRFPDLVSIDLRLPQASEVVGNGIFAIQAEMLGVGANESFVEHAARKLIELLLLDGLKHACADLGDVGNVIKREVFALARIAEFVSELAHGFPDIVGVTMGT